MKKSVSGIMTWVLTVSCLSIVAASAASAATQAYVHQQERVHELLQILQVIYQEAVTTPGGQDDNADIYETITTILTDIEDPALLGLIAVTTWIMYEPGEAEAVRFDQVWYQTYRTCLEKLAQHPDPRSDKVLHSIQECYLGLEGEEQAVFEKIMKKARK